MNCDRCHAATDTLHVCRHCRRGLCGKCAGAGCCGRVPAALDHLLVTGGELTLVEPDEDGDDTEVYTEADVHEAAKEACEEIERHWRDQGEAGA
jgi:hypothetical protein